jgi:alkaline phosphatase
LIVVTADHETGGLTLENDLDLSNLTGISWTTFGHTGQPVTTCVVGPGEELLGSRIDSTDIARFMAQVLGVTLEPPYDPSVFIPSAQTAAPVRPR